MITEDLEVQGQVKTSPLMPNVNTTLNYEPSFFHLLQSECNKVLISEFENR